MTRPGIVAYLDAQAPESGRQNWLALPDLQNLLSLTVGGPGPSRPGRTPRLPAPPLHDRGNAPVGIRIAGLQAPHRSRLRTLVPKFSISDIA